MPFHLYWKAVPSDPKTLSLAKGEKNSEICVEHVIGEEKYEWEILKEVVMESKILVGRVCCAAFSGFFLGILWLYL